MRRPHCVMILQERHCPRGPPAHQPRRLARSIPQAPELAAFEDCVQDAFGRDVKGSGIASGIIDPVDYALPVSILQMGSNLSQAAPASVQCRGGFMDRTCHGKGANDSRRLTCRADWSHPTVICIAWLLCRRVTRA